MAYRLLTLTLNHAQRRVQRPRIGITAMGRDFEEGHGLVVCPATGAVRLRANYDRPEFQKTNTGAFKKLAIADYDLLDLNTPAGQWRPFGFDHDQQFVTYIGENVAGVGATTTEAWPTDQGMAVGVFAYSAGTQQDDVLAEMGWSPTGNGTVGPSLRVYYDGRVALFHDGVIVAPAVSLSGTAGYGRATQEYVLITIERGRGRDLVVRTSKGGAATIRCPWVDPEDSESALLPATKFWWYIPRGGATVMVCPIVYETSGYGDTRPYYLAEAPGAGETLQDWTGSDRFGTLSNAHVIGHPQGGEAAFELRKPDGTAPFVPDGAARVCRARLTLTSPDGVTSPWVWGVHAAYREKIALTASASVDIGPCLASPIRLSLPDSSDGLTAEWEATALDTLEALAPHCLDGEGTPVMLADVDPDGELPPIVWLDGELLPSTESDSFRRATQRARMKAVDRLAAARAAKVRETLPLDGMPMCQPATSGISAVLVCLREMGVDDSETDLPDLDWRLPDVPMDGAERSPTGEWNLAAVAGDLWGDVLDRIFARAPNVVYGMRPFPDGGYGFLAREPDDGDAPVAILFRSVAAAMEADPDLTVDQAERLLYDGSSREPLPIEGNDVRVMGYDPGRRGPIAAVATWTESADPTIAPEFRFPGWLGRRRGVEFSDPGLTTIDDCRKVCEGVFAAATAERELNPYTAQLPTSATGVPVWRGDVVVLDDHLGKGAPRTVRTAAWSLEIADESGQGAMPGDERPPSRLASVVGGALVGYGGVAAWEIVDIARDRARSNRRFKGWQAIEGISPLYVVKLP
jgi:hypothetical protein